MSSSLSPKAGNSGRAVVRNGDPDEKVRALLLVPARNEAATIGSIVRDCHQAGFTVWVIDDASTDGTGEVARKAGAQVLQPSGPHYGKTAALRYALERIPEGIDWLCFLDADGQHRPADLDRFWRQRHQADLVVGTRFSDAARMPFLRRITNQFMSSLLARSGIHDSQCGFRLVRRAWLGDWLPQGSHYEFETELALRAIARAARVRNVAIRATYAGEQSKIVVWRDAVNFVQCFTR